MRDGGDSFKFRRSLDRGGVYLKLGGGGKVIEGRQREKKRETTFEG